MQKLATIFLSVILIGMPAIADKGKVVATYKGGKVTEAEVMKQFGPVLNSQPQNKGKKFAELDKNIQEVLVKGYINSKLLEQEAEKLGISKSKSFQEKLKSVKMEMIKQELIERTIKNKINDKMIDEEYAKLKTNLKGKKEIKVRHILVDTEEKAKEIKKKLNKGAKFADLVQKFSKDESSKANGGEIGYLMKGQLVPEFENKAFSLKKNEISDPVKTQFGWHIIKLIDKRDVKMPTKEQAMQGIKAKLSREIITKYFEDLAAKADIKLKLK